MELKLRSPAGGSPRRFSLALISGSGYGNEKHGYEIIETIMWVCEDLPEIKLALLKNILCDYDTKSYESMKLLCDRFNRAIGSFVKMVKGTSLHTQRLNRCPSRGMLRYILQQAYNESITHPEKLNQYEPFSSEVYGETSYDVVCQMIDKINVTPEDVFIDLGSGVGQIVLQMAAATPCKECWGIEKSEVPSSYAEALNKSFCSWMQWYGKRVGDYELIKGDFLKKEHREKITSATIVFLNNFAFDPLVDHQLKEIFCCLKDGTRIISSKSLCSLNFRLTERNLSDIGAIVDVSEITTMRGSVSWTDKPVSYYLHVINRSKLENCSLSNNQLISGNESNIDFVIAGVGRQKSHQIVRQLRERLPVSYCSEVSSDEDYHDKSYVPPTRRVWFNTDTTNDSEEESNEDTKRQSKNSRRIKFRIAREKSLRNLGQPLEDYSTDTDDDYRDKSPVPLTKRASPNSCVYKDTTRDSDEESNDNSSCQSKFQPLKGLTSRSRQKRVKKVQPKKLIEINHLHSSNLLRTSPTCSAAVEKEVPPTPELAALGIESVPHDEFHVSEAFRTEQQSKNLKERTARSKKRMKKIEPKKFIQNLRRTSTTTPAEIENEVPSIPQLTALSVDNVDHNEFHTSQALQNTPPALQILLDKFKTQLLAEVEQMKHPSFKNTVEMQTKEETDRNRHLKNQAAQLEKKIKFLIDHSVVLLQARMSELCLNVFTPDELFNKAKELVKHHKELQTKVRLLQIEVTDLEQKNNNLVRLSQHAARKIPSYLTNREKLPNQIELGHLEKSVLESQANVVSKQQVSKVSSKPIVRSLNWTDIPDLSKIEEQNPESLAKKNLEMGRAVEESKLLDGCSKQAQPLLKHVTRSSKRRRGVFGTRKRKVKKSHPATLSALNDVEVIDKVPKYKQATQKWEVS